MNNLPNVPAVPYPFAQNGDKNSIPTSQATSGNGLASWNTGFPPETALPVSGGGIPPSRDDLNGTLNVATFPQYFLQMGGFYSYDDNVATAIGGYPLGAVLTYYDSANKVVRKLRSKYANNTHNFISNPSFIGSWWEDVTPCMETGGHLFDIFASFSTAAPFGAVRLDGRTLTENDYPDFYAEAVERKTAGTIPTLTAIQYQNQLTQYGQCGSFVVDTEAKTVRIPKLKSFIQNGTPGTVHSAGLPNISGGFIGTYYKWSVPAGASYYGAFRNDQNDWNGVEVSDEQVRTGQATFNASRSNSIYGKSTTVQPESIEVRYYIQVKKGNMSGAGGSGGGITSADAEIIASGAAANVFTSSIVAGGYVDSSGAVSAVSSAGYIVSASARTIASEVFTSGGIISGSLTVSSGGKIYVPDGYYPGHADMGVSAGNGDSFCYAYMSAYNGAEDTRDAKITVAPGDISIRCKDYNANMDYALVFAPSSGLVLSDFIASGAKVVALQLTTSTIYSGGAIVFDNLPSGISYIYDSALTELTISNIESDCRAEIDFTADTGFNLGLPSGAGIKLIGISSYDSGTHYLVAVDGARVVVNGYTIVGE